MPFALHSFLPAAEYMLTATCTHRHQLKESGESFFQGVEILFEKDAGILL